MSVRAMILAGGSGTRLWPSSREQFPKPFLPLFDGETLFQRTCNRAKVVADHLQVICGEKHIHLVNKDLAGEKAHVIGEPCGRNTAPAILLGMLNADDPEHDIFMVMPADHLIQPEHVFKENIQAAIRLAAEGKIVTLGIQPSYPETGYGYIETAGRGLGSQEVMRFHEKPDAETAESFLKTQRFYWNAGLFVFQGQIMLEAFRKFEPQLLTDVQNYVQNPEAQKYQDLKSISIDYAIMERAQNLGLVPATFAWSDVGSWQAVHQASQPDYEKNVSQGDVLLEDCSSSFVRSESRLVLVQGMNDICLVETSDAVMLAPLSQSQKVKDLLAKAVLEKPELAEGHLKVERPWGSFTQLAQESGFQVKRLDVYPGMRLSLQSHLHRDEHWVVVRGKAVVTRGDEQIELSLNQSIFIPKTERHRIENPGPGPLTIIEVQVGDYLGEDDITRYSDDFGRS